MRSIFFSSALTLLAIASQAAPVVDVIGGNGNSNITTWLNSNGYAASNLNAVGGASGSGQVIIIGYDWADGFPATTSNNGKLLLNALNAKLAVATPEPAVGLATGLGILVLGWVARKRRAA